MSRRSPGWQVLQAVCAIVGVLACLAFVLSVVPFVVMITFNAVAPVFWKSAPHLTFIQSWCVVTLVSVISGLLRTTFTVKKD